MKFIEIEFLVKDDAEPLVYLLFSIHRSTAIVVADPTFGSACWQLICRSSVLFMILLLLIFLAHNSTIQRWNGEVTLWLRYFDTHCETVLSLYMLKHGHLLTLELLIFHEAVNIIIFLRLTEQDVELVGVKRCLGANNITTIRSGLVQSSFLVGNHRRHTLRLNDILNNALPILEALDTQILII